MPCPEVRQEGCVLGSASKLRHPGYHFHRLRVCGAIRKPFDPGNIELERLAGIVNVGGQNKLSLA